MPRLDNIVNNNACHEPSYMRLNAITLVLHNIYTLVCCLGHHIVLPSGKSRRRQMNPDMY